MRPLFLGKTAQIPLAEVRLLWRTGSTVTTRFAWECGNEEQ